MPQLRRSAGPTSVLNADEQIVLDAYFARTPDSDYALSPACDRLGVPEEVNEFTRCQAAAAQVLVRDLQHLLPQRASFVSGRLIKGRTVRKRNTDASSPAPAQHLFTINWGDSPAFSWPDAYHLIYASTHKRFVVVSSQSNSDHWGCTDQAIDHFGEGMDNRASSQKIICKAWAWMHENFCQAPWDYVEKGGLFRDSEIERWKRRVWAKSEYRTW